VKTEEGFKADGALCVGVRVRLRAYCARPCAPKRLGRGALLAAAVRLPREYEETVCRNGNTRGSRKPVHRRAVRGHASSVALYPWTRVARKSVGVESLGPRSVDGEPELVGPELEGRLAEARDDHNVVAAGGRPSMERQDAIQLVDVENVRADRAQPGQLPAQA